VEQLKASIEEREWIPAGLQRLVCGATPLTTGLLSEMGVGEEDTISLLMDIRVRVFSINLLWCVSLWWVVARPMDRPMDRAPPPFHTHRS
jgi:hypothetical protein